MTTLDEAVKAMIDEAVDSARDEYERAVDERVESAVSDALADSGYLMADDLGTALDDEDVVREGDLESAVESALDNAGVLTSDSFGDEFDTALQDADVLARSDLYDALRDEDTVFTGDLDEYVTAEDAKRLFESWYEERRREERGTSTAERVRGVAARVKSSLRGRLESARRVGHAVMTQR